MNHLRVQTTAVLLCALLCAALPAFAQETSPPPPPPEEVDRSESQPEAAQEVAPPPDAEPAPIAPSAASRVPEISEPAAVHKVVLRDGQFLRGRVLSQTPTEVVLELHGGGLLRIPADLVSEVKLERDVVQRADGSLWFPDANRTRYFYSPSAMMLKKGQAYFSQKELLFSSFAYGVTDNFSLLVGTVAPAWFFGIQGINGIVGLKAGAPVTEKIHIAAGLEALAIPNVSQSGSASPFVAGLLFGSATFGEADRHLTVSVGKPVVANLAQSTNNVVSMDLITTLSANYRVHQNVSLLTENWLVIPSFENGQWATGHAFGGRFIGERIAADVGLIWFVIPQGATGQPGLATAIPIPWVDFTYNFDFAGR